MKDRFTQSQGAVCFSSATGRTAQPPCVSGSVPGERGRQHSGGRAPRPPLWLGATSISWQLCGDVSRCRHSLCVGLVFFLCLRIGVFLAALEILSQDSLKRRVAGVLRERTAPSPSPFLSAAGAPAQGRLPASARPLVPTCRSLGFLFSFTGHLLLMPPLCFFTRPSFETFVLFLK